MRMRHSSIPVVAAPHQLCLGGGTELCLHADKVVAHAETYMGLVEFGVGVIPGGGGTKEFALRLSDELKDGDIRITAEHVILATGSEPVELPFLPFGGDVISSTEALSLSFFDPYGSVCQATGRTKKRAPSGTGLS